MLTLRLLPLTPCAQLLLEHGSQFFDIARKQAMRDASAAASAAHDPSQDFMNSPLLGGDREAAVRGESLKV